FGATRTTPLQGVLATITPADIPAPTATQIARRQNQLPDVTSDYDQFTYTIRVQVRDQPGNRLGEDRRTIFIHHDPDLKAPYPLKIGGDGASSPHDVRVSPDKHRDNPVDRAIVASPALTDLDGDGGLDIIVGANDRHLYVWDGFGTPRPGFPVVVADPTRVSIDPVTHKVTPLAGSCNGSPGPANCAFRGEKIMDSPAIGDIDHDGALDIVVGTNEEYNEPINASLSSGTSMAVAELLAASGSAHPANTRD